MLPGGAWEPVRDTPPYPFCVMDSKERRAAVAVPRRGAELKRAPAPAIPRQNNWRTFPSAYFGVESLLGLLCLTASLLILPLVLPPLPPPPFLLLLVPVGILAVLMALALMPYDVRDIASYL